MHLPAHGAVLFGVGLALLGGLAQAKTDYAGCTSFTSMVTVSNRSPPEYYRTVVHFVPDTLEVCQAVDCGGGRAPPKSVPGCPLYEGTDTVTARFLTADPFKTTTSSSSRSSSSRTAALVSDGTAAATAASSTLSGTAPAVTSPPDASNTGSSAGESGAAGPSTTVPVAGSAAASLAGFKGVYVVVGLIAATLIAI